MPLVDEEKRIELVELYPVQSRQRIEKFTVEVKTDLLKQSNTSTLVWFQKK